jgi:hypothetical protein
VAEQRKKETGMNSNGHSAEYKAIKVELDKNCELFDEKIAAQRELLEEKIKGLIQADANLKEATLLAHKGIEDHQKAANNLQTLLREQEQDNARRLERYVPLAEYNIYHLALETQMKDLQLSKAKAEGESSKAVFIGYATVIISGLALALSIVLHFVH